MSYLVLARKYRPRDFSQVVGQEHVVRALTHALEQKRLHHAYLFTGTRGIGKTTLSRILAKSLNCTGADGQGDVTATPCGVCAACTAIDAGRFVDYVELDAASNRGVDEVQGLLEQAVYKPVQGRFKVFMIDEVHMLSNTAFNAMLKTLEEPPEYLKFVLATTDPQKVPVTVLSRCLQFNLRPMAPETVAEQLRSILDQEHIAAEQAALALLAQAAHGSMRDALSLTDQAIAYGGGELEADAVRHMLGSVSREVVLQLIEALTLGDGRRVVDLAGELRARGQAAAPVLEDMARILQRMAVRQVARAALEDGGGDPDAAAIERLAGLLPADETQLLYSLCIHGRAELGLAPDEYVGLTMALLRFLPFRSGAGGAPGASAEKKTPAEPSGGSLTHGRRDEAGGAPAAAGRRRESEPGVVASSSSSEPVRGRVREESPKRPDDPYRVPVVAAPVRNSEPVHGDASVSGARGAASAEARTSGASLAAPDTASARVEPEAESSAPGEEASAQARVDLGSFWRALVERMIEQNIISALPRELALQSDLIERAADRWLLRVGGESLARSAVRERLEAALATMGHTVSLEVEVGAVSASLAQQREAREGERMAAATALVMHDPFVQEMMQKFGAKVVPGSIRPL